MCLRNIIGDGGCLLALVLGPFRQVARGAGREIRAEQFLPRRAATERLPVEEDMSARGVAEI